MKTLIALLALCLISSSVYAKKSAAVPVPTASPILAQAQVNPDPFNRARVGETAPTPSPGTTVQPAPIAPAPVPVAVQAQPQETSVVGWTQTGLLGVLAALFGKVAFFPKHGAPAVGTSAPAKPGDIVPATPSHSLINDTALGMIERLIETGLPGEAIQLAMSLIPRAGPLVSKLEPAFRQISIKFLQSKIGTVATVVPAGQTAVAPNDVLGTLAGLVAQHPAAAGTGVDAVQRLEEILTLLKAKAA